MVVLAIYTNPEDPQTVTECYQFKFKYTSSGPVMDFTSHKNSSSSSCLDVKKASILLVRKLYVLMQNLGPLPNDVCLTMKLFYYDEVTPKDYQPPGFKEGDSEGMMFEGEPMYLNVGEVATPYHVLKVKVTTEKERMENIEKNILKDGETKPPTQPIRLDLEEAENPERPMNEDLAEDNNEVGEKNAIESLKVEDLRLTCEEDETMRSDESQSAINTHSQTEQTLQAIPSPTECRLKTRSGRIFQNLDHASNSKTEQKTKSSKQSKKRNRPDKPTQPFEISGSQDEPTVSKRRKFSEPKEPF
ncbi:hypothetical protein FKM82_018593 [Ascaphus truei]